jgi:hypothetical protein
MVRLRLKLTRVTPRLFLQFQIGDSSFFPRSSHQRPPRPPPSPQLRQADAISVEAWAGHYQPPAPLDLEVQFAQAIAAHLNAPDDQLGSECGMPNFEDDPAAA